MRAPSWWLPLGLGVAIVACNASEDPAPAGTGNNTNIGQPKAPNTGPEEEKDKTPPVVSPADDPNAKPCTGAAGEIYALSARKLAGTEDIPLCRFKGKVMVLLNGASHCGQTYQYEPLQKLYAAHQAAGLEILAFPSKSFDQEDSDEKTVSDFCTGQKGIKFPLFAIAPVTGNDIQPVFKWLTAQPGGTGAIEWNFVKFLVGRDGKLVKRYAFNKNPDPASDPEVENDIKAALAKQ